ncbi:hypothetical protein Stsp01_55030 [Streptomyces sp. NBRC 13847]|uniref:hypothetical protein n=1 Tax=Streptomyces TaxID=1883 RepID=UPI0024A60AD8|nr:hypothetical protein [Streptomyces sp. NBRC 13847]GLW18760.1 hypothetical protein Stsp01_55030 [Streptomyces sp. NBRC 13847]
MDRLDALLSHRRTARAHLAREADGPPLDATRPEPHARGAARTPRQPTRTP